MPNARPTDFRLTRAPAVRVASIVRIGPWKEDHLRDEFRELTRWAARARVRTGRWIFRHARDRPRRWEACLEIRGPAASEGRIRVTTLPAAWVAEVSFDPDAVASRLVYHGLHDWTRARRKRGEIRAVVGSREIYAADPWRDRAAWAHCTVQFLVRR